MKVIALTLLVSLCGSCGSGDERGVTAVAPEAGEQGRVLCGSGPFPAEGLTAEVGAEEGDSASSQGLRELIENPDGIGELPETGWRLFFEDSASAIFGVELDERWLVVTLRSDDDAWVFSSSGGCDRPVLMPPAGASTAVWWLDPSAGDQRGSATLHVLAKDLDCASGVPADDRLREPEVYENDQRVVITFWADRVEGDQSCPDHDPAARTIELGAPLGERSLLDGAYWPAATPTER